MKNEYNVYEDRDNENADIDDPGYTSIRDCMLARQTTGPRSTVENRPILRNPVRNLNHVDTKEDRPVDVYAVPHAPPAIPVKKFAVDDVIYEHLNKPEATPPMDRSNNHVYGLASAKPLVTSVENVPGKPVTLIDRDCVHHTSM